MHSIQFKIDAAYLYILLTQADHFRTLALRGVPSWSSCIPSVGWGVDMPRNRGSIVGSHNEGCELQQLLAACFIAYCGNQIPSSLQSLPGNCVLK